ncbi:ATP-binding protein [Hazenella coriacea]|uniref:Putative ATP-dependent endonuclease of OLD family n=1 Tax=Hazenella coriacea TaxID=1179467 RepID=A0A4R3L318_9BACL|nr:ATP-binding protein [Hazenella coriacea]TCS93295.1 putative ATP-dependent endonuclease of OLD family [Hazenella coriacea]
MILELSKGGSKKLILRKLTLRNFRGYKECEINFSRDITAIIGKNDIGKSTILEALEVFFADAPHKLLDVSDLCITTQEDIIEITTYFELLEDENEVIIDSSHPTDFKKENLLNEEGLLEIKLSVKVDRNASTITSGSVTRSLLAYYPKVFSKKPLITLNNSALKKLITDEIKSKYTDLNLTINATIRSALYRDAITSNPEKEMVEINIGEIENQKKAWEKIKLVLPIYQLFKVDRSNSDKDKDVQDPIKMVVAESVKGIEKEFYAMARNVEKQVKEVLENTIEKLKEFPQFSGVSLTPNMNIGKLDSLFSFNIDTDNGIPLNKRGSGIRRLVLLSYFRAEADRVLKNSEKSSVIYAIEEPETSQHPDFQKMIIESLIKIARADKRQVFITTHSPEVAGFFEIEDINLIERKGGYPVICALDHNQKADKIIETLGQLPSISSKVVMFVEGENDIRFIRAIGQLPTFKSIIDIEKDVSIMPTNGGQLVNIIKKRYLKNIDVPEFHFYDSDVQPYIDAVNEMNQDVNGSRMGFCTNYNMLENYVPTNRINEFFNTEIEDSKTIDIVSELKSILKKWNDKQIKAKLNEDVMKNVLEEDLEKHGVFEELKDIFVVLNHLKNKNFSDAQSIVNKRMLVHL